MSQGERRPGAALGLDPGARRGEERWALGALGAVILLTGGWWALALWPLPDSTPEWLVRTRAVCFGNRRDALPPPGGWLLLLSQPVGMLAVLMTVWGGALRSGLTGLARSGLGRLALAAGSLVLLAGAGGVGWRVATAEHAVTPEGAAEGRLLALSDPAPALKLVNQHGDSVALDRFRGRPVLVTFAFAHCETVCPTLVRAALDTRRRFETAGVVALVVTLDPWRDTPSRLPSIAARWDLGPDEHFLSGSVEAVEASLNAWKVPRVRNQATGELIHPSVTYVVGPRGDLAYLTDGSGPGVARALGMLIGTGVTPAGAPGGPGVRSLRADGTA